MKRLALAAAASLLLAKPAGATVELKYNNWSPPRSLEGQMIPKVAADLEKATNGNVKIRVFGGGQLLSGPATLAGLRDGAIDMGFIIPTLNPGELRHVSMIPELLPFATNGLAAAAAADQTIMLDCPECRQDFDAQNSIWLGSIGASPWHLMCRDPLTSLADMKNRKSRVTGGMAARMLEALGGIGVQMTPPEIAQALTGRQIDCTVGPLDWMLGLRLTETVKTLVDHNLGIYAGIGVFVFNKASLAKIPAADREILRREIPKHIADMSLAYQTRIAEVKDASRKANITLWSPSQDFRDALAKFKAGEIQAIAADMTKRNVQNPERLIRLHLANIEKWHKLMEGIGTDREKYVAALWNEIFSKVTF